MKLKISNSFTLYFSPCNNIIINYLHFQIPLTFV
jgi:hypothetical protein